MNKEMKSKKRSKSLKNVLEQRNGRTKVVWIHKDSVDRRYPSKSEDSIIFPIQSS
jgi:hypothetical protein